MQSLLTRLLLTGLCLALAACAGTSSIFDGPPVPYGKVMLGGKEISVMRLGADCVCPRIVAADSPVQGAVLPARAGCNDGGTICTPDSIHVYEHEALEVATGLRHSDTPDHTSGCYDVLTAGGEYRKGDQLCVGSYGDYRIAGKTNIPETSATAPAPAAEPLRLQLTSVCTCTPDLAVAQRRVAAKAG